MADSIIMQGPGYTIARISETETGVPYGEAIRPDGQRNHGFFDLRNRPELVAQIPEAQNSAGMQAVLQALNSIDSRFMSLGCARGVFPQQEAQPGEPTYLCGSYIQMAYRESTLNSDPDRFINLSKKILSAVVASPEYHFGFEMIVEPLRSFFGASGCFALMVKPLGYGTSEITAIAAWEYAAAAVAEAITNINSEGK